MLSQPLCLLRLHCIRTPRDSQIESQSSCEPPCLHPSHIPVVPLRKAQRLQRQPDRQGGHPGVLLSHRLLGHLIAATLRQQLSSTQPIPAVRTSAICTANMSRFTSHGPEQDKLQVVGQVQHIPTLKDHPRTCGAVPITPHLTCPLMTVRERSASHSILGFSLTQLKQQRDHRHVLRLPQAES